MNENGISIYQNLSLDVDNKKQIKFLRLKILLLFKGLLNALRFFFYSPSRQYYSNIQKAERERQVLKFYARAETMLQDNKKKNRN